MKLRRRAGRPRPPRRGLGPLRLLVSQPVWITGGAAIGLALVLPVRDVGARCPAEGEGLGMCVVQKAWAPAFVVFCACMIAAALLWTLLFERAPLVWRRVRRGERPVRRTPAPAAPPYDDDPFLLAATRGVRMGGGDRRPRATNRVRPDVEELRRRWQSRGEAG